MCICRESFLCDHCKWQKNAVFRGFIYWSKNEGTGLPFALYLQNCCLLSSGWQTPFCLHCLFAAPLCTMSSGICIFCILFDIIVDFTSKLMEENILQLVQLLVNYCLKISSCILSFLKMGIDRSDIRYPSGKSQDSSPNLAPTVPPPFDQLTFFPFPSFRDPKLLRRSFSYLMSALLY